MRRTCYENRVHNGSIALDRIDRSQVGGDRFVFCLFVSMRLFSPDPQKFHRMVE